jgi:hypothetical protein
MKPICGPVSLVIVVVLGLSVAVAVGVARYNFVERFLPVELVALFDGMKKADAAEVSADDETTDTSASVDGPGQYLADASDGLLAQGPIAAMRGNSPVYIEDVITGYTTRVELDIPAEITTIRPILGCRLTPPLEGSIVGHVTSGTSQLPLAMWTYNDTHLAVAVQSFVNRYRKAGGESDEIGGGPTYEAYDVAVTETAAPVYLVLENGSGNRIWNIHLAPGARIERVVLLGGDHAGVANLDPVVPVEVLLGEALVACGIEPAYTLNPGHLLYQSLANGAVSKAEAEIKLAAVKDAVAAYDIWFRDTFGILADESRAGFAQGTISVVGPVPDEGGAKAIFVPIKGSRVRTTRDVFFEIRGQVAEGEDFASQVKAIATAFAFGDLNSLKQGVEF